jgi:ABC-2 type transport system permease protein
MILKMASFEWRYFTRQPSFIVTSLVFFLFPFILATLEGDQLTGSSNLNINSPHAISQTLLIFSVFAIFLVVNFVANTAMRNSESRMAEIILSKPISALKYQLGRFLGAYLVVLTVFAMVPLALFIGALMPWLDQERIGAFSFSAYLTPYFIFSATTLFVLSSIFYAVALRFRSMMAVYLVALGIFMLYVVSDQIFADQGDRELFALLDPFALNTYSDITRYWTPAERNSQVVTLFESVLINRGFWLAIGVITLLVLGRLFKPLSLHTQSAKRSKTLSSQASADSKSSNAQTNKFARVSFVGNTSFSNGQATHQFTTRLLFEMKQVFLSPAFAFLMLFCGFSLVSILLDPQGLYATPNWPLTQYMVEMIEGAFGLALIIVITYYTAEVVWRERSVGMGDIVDSLPVSNISFWASKFIAVSLVVIAVLLLGMIATVINQALNAYMHFEFTQYFVSLLYFQALPWILLVVLSFFVQVLSPNKYLGMLFFVAFFFVTLAFNELGIEHNMFNYGTSPLMRYSDMNGYGWSLTTQHYYMAYWGALALVLCVLSFGLWQRGPQSSLKNRFMLLGYQLGNSGRVFLVAGTMTFVALGTIIHFNTTQTNQFVSADQSMDLQANYEKQFIEYLDDAMPMITTMDIDIAIFPHARRIETLANVTLLNNNDTAISRFLVNLPQYSSDIQIDIEGAKLGQVNTEFDTAWLEFDEPLQPNSQITGKMGLVRQHFGFKDRREDTSLVTNGTFIINFELLPTFGVNQAYFLSDRHERRKRDLPPPMRAYPLEDKTRYNESFFGPHIGLIDFSATLSTSEEQIAIAPGYLQKYWVEMDAPMINFFSVMSADLAVKTQIHNGVEITVYYHQDHYWNVERMIESVQDSIDLFTEAFGPYQHRQLRIIEFPGYRSFAQSFANTVPYSERIGFISDLRDPRDIDPVYYVTAHEVAHQWFGHQLNAANVQGSSILSESLSQYAALLVMQEKYGEAKIRQFLREELDSYLRGRTQEALEEMPFMRAENQQYIHYNKGSVVMMAIADRIGVDALNTALSKLIARYKFSRGAQPTTLDLLSAIKEQASSKDYDFIDQQFTQINLYDLRLEDVAIEALPKEDGQQTSKYSLTLNVSAAQYLADGQGEETKTEFSDYVDVVLFANDPDDFSVPSEIIYRKKHLLTDGDNSLVIEVDSLPEYAAVDPFIRFIDRESRDNIKAIP